MISSILALSSSGTSSSSSCGPQQVNVSKNELGAGLKVFASLHLLIRSENYFLGLVHLLCLLSFFGCVLVSDLVECCKNVLLIAYKSDPPSFSCTFCHRPSYLNQTFKVDFNKYIFSRSEYHLP